MEKVLRKTDYFLIAAKKQRLKDQLYQIVNQYYTREWEI